MIDPDRLRLAAFDDEDLGVIAAYLQDAVLKVGDIVYLPGDRRFALAMNRFSWERAENEAAVRNNQAFERRRAALTFDRVLKVKTSGIDRRQADMVLELLTVTFEPAEAPAGNVTLVFAGGAAIQLEVEVIEARLADLGPAWATKARPSHDLADSETKPGA